VRAAGRTKECLVKCEQLIECLREVELLKGLCPEIGCAFVWIQEAASATVV
jgi:hypothetical protein